MIGLECIIGPKWQAEKTVDWHSSCAQGPSARAVLCWCSRRPERWSTDSARICHTPRVGTPAFSRLSADDENGGDDSFHAWRSNDLSRLKAGVPAGRQGAGSDRGS